MKVEELLGSYIRHSRPVSRNKILPTPYYCQAGYWKELREGKMGKVSITEVHVPKR